MAKTDKIKLKKEVLPDGTERVTVIEGGDEVETQSEKE